MKKSAFFIDGAYLNRVLKNNFNSFNLDYGKFCDEIAKMLNVYRLRTYYYNCMPFRRRGNETDEKRYAGVQKFISKLKRLPRFEVKLGELQLVGNQFKQKMIDVLMSLDILDISLDGGVEEVVIIAGDADFVPVIKKVKDRGVVVHLFYHSSSVHNQLMDEVDELHKIDNQLIEGSGR